MGVVKHCGHGFALDHEGKDSWQFMQSGSEGVALVSADRLAVIKKHDELVDLSQVAREYFPETDFVLVEGGRGDRGLKKVVVLNDETIEAAQIPPDELMAVVSKKKLQADKPVFSPDQIHEIAGFLEKISI